MPLARAELPLTRGIMTPSLPSTPQTGGSNSEEDRKSSGRPQSALARGVQVVELPDMRINPRPVPISDDMEMIMKDYMTVDRLRDLSGKENLDDVEFLELHVDTRETSLGTMGAHLRNLKQLKLSNSIILSMRDLGSCLAGLTVLWMPRCGLGSLDGVSAMTRITELYLAFNDISDISPCSLLPLIAILDLECNSIDDISQVTFLALCPCLHTLTLEGNPVCVSSNPSSADPTYCYRDEVRSAVPQLKTLDDLPLYERVGNQTIKEKSYHRSAELTGQSREDKSLGDKASSGKVKQSGRVNVKQTGSGDGSVKQNVFEEDWKLIEEMMKEGILIDDEIMAEDEISQNNSCISTSKLSTAASSCYRPGTSILKPHTAARPGSGRVPSRPGSAFRTAENLDDAVDLDPTCELTTGRIVCGSVSRALKERRKDSRSNVTLKQSTKSSTGQMLKDNGMLSSKKAGPSTKSATGRPTTEDVDIEFDKLTAEIKKWKEGHKRRMTEISSSKAPQVLKITYDDIEALLTDEEEDKSDKTDLNKNKIASGSTKSALNKAAIISRPSARRSEVQKSSTVGSTAAAGADDVVTAEDDLVSGSVSEISPSETGSTWGSFRNPTSKTGTEARKSACKEASVSSSPRTPAPLSKTRHSTTSTYDKTQAQPSLGASTSSPRTQRRKPDDLTAPLPVRTSFAFTAPVLASPVSSSPSGARPKEGIEMYKSPLSSITKRSILPNVPVLPSKFTAK